MGKNFIKIASLYLLAGILLGVFMDVSRSFQYTSTHARILLLGWVTTGLFGIIYHIFPQLGDNRLGKTHFWTHNIGVPILSAGLLSFALGNQALGIPCMTVGGLLILVGTVVFIINLFKN